MEIALVVRSKQFEDWAKNISAPSTERVCPLPINIAHCPEAPSRLYTGTVFTNSNSYWAGCFLSVTGQETTLHLTGWWCGHCDAQVCDSQAWLLQCTLSMNDNTSCDKVPVGSKHRSPSVLLSNTGGCEAHHPGTLPTAFIVQCILDKIQFSDTTSKTDFFSPTRDKYNYFIF